jgi:hypothetical protein
VCVRVCVCACVRVCVCARVCVRVFAGCADKVAAKFPTIFGRPGVTVEASPAPVEGPALKVGVVLSGGQAPGGHNVIGAWGVWVWNARVVLVGVCQQGPPKPETPPVTCVAWG